MILPQPLGSITNSNRSFNLDSTCDFSTRIGLRTVKSMKI